MSSRQFNSHFILVRSWRHHSLELRCGQTNNNLEFTGPFEPGYLSSRALILFSWAATVSSSFFIAACIATRSIWKGEDNMNATGILIHEWCCAKQFPNTTQVFSQLPKCLDVTRKQVIYFIYKIILGLGGWGMNWGRHWSQSERMQYQLFYGNIVTVIFWFTEPD